MGRRWTDEDVEALKQMATRYRLPEIAEKMNRTVGGVTFKAHMLKLSLRPAVEQHVEPKSYDPGPAGFDRVEPEAASVTRTGPHRPG